jgi:hypothetical protein
MRLGTSRSIRGHLHEHFILCHDLLLQLELVSGFDGWMGKKLPGGNIEHLAAFDSLLRNGYDHQQEEGRA